MHVCPESCNSPLLLMMKINYPASITDCCSALILSPSPTIGWFQNSKWDFTLKLFHCIECQSFIVITQFQWSIIKVQESLMFDESPELMIMYDGNSSDCDMAPMTPISGD